MMGKFVLKMDWLWLTLGLQGSVVGVQGAEQTWFITPLLLCYAITPVVSRWIYSIQEKKTEVMIVALVAVLPLFYALIPNPAYHTLLSLVSYYVIAFIIGTSFKKDAIHKKRLIVLFSLIYLSFVLRIVLRHFFDGTIIYDRIGAGYTHIVSAFCIFYIFASLLDNVKPIKGVEFISSISFEIYLVHYMFCVGPIKLFGRTPNWLLDCVLVTAITIATSFAMNKLSACIIRKLP